MKDQGNQGSQEPNPKNSREDFSSDFIMPPELISLRIRRDTSSSGDDYDGDPHTPLSEDFGPTSSPFDFLEEGIRGQLFVTNGEFSYIIDTSSFSLGTIGTITEHGWFVSHPVPAEYSGSTVLVGVMQIAEKLGISAEKLFYAEEPLFHELKKRSDDEEDDKGGGEQHFCSAGHLPVFSLVSNIAASSNSKEKESSATSTSGTIASLALNGLIIISAMTVMSLTGSGYLDLNPIADSFRHNFLEGMDYYMMS